MPGDGVQMDRGARSESEITESVTTELQLTAQTRVLGNNNKKKQKNKTDRQCSALGGRRGDGLRTNLKSGSRKSKGGGGKEDRERERLEEVRK